MGIRHATVAVGTDSGSGEIHKAEWNADHVGFDGMVNPMTAPGDMIYGGGTPTNKALLSLGATASGNLNDGFTAVANAIDGVDSSYALRGNNAAGGIVTIDLGVAATIVSMRLLSPGGNYSTPASFDVRYSANGITWTLLERHSNGGQVSDDVWTLSTPTLARYWELDNPSGTAGEWRIYTFEIRGTVPSDTGTPLRLPGTTTFGRSLLTQADASAARTTLGLVPGTDIASLTSGRVPIAQLGSGSPSGVKFLRDDGVLAVPLGTNLFPPATNSGEGAFSLGGGYTEAGSGVAVTDGHRYRVTVLGWDLAGTGNMGVSFGASTALGADAWHNAPTFDTIPVVGGNMRLIGRNNGGNLVGTGWTYQDLGDIPATGTILRYGGSTQEWSHPRIPTKAGVPTDSDVIGGVPAADGMMILDTTNGRLYVRSGGTWKYSTLT